MPGIKFFQGKIKGRKLVGEDRYSRGIFFLKRPSSAFSPLDYEPVLWLESDFGLCQERTGASASTPASSDSDPVGTWLDQSGNANHATATADSKRPVVKLAIQNGLPVVRFDGVDDVLEVADRVALRLANITVFAVAKVAGAGTNNSILLLKNASSPSTNAAYGLLKNRFGGGAGKVTLGVNNGSGWTDCNSDSVLDDGDWALLTASFNGSDWAHRRNGVADGSGTHSGSITATTGILQIGGYNASFSSAEFLNGDIAALLLFDSALSDSDKGDVESYLNSKYGIY